MKQRASFVKRCLALALALVLLVSQVNFGLVQTVRANSNGVNTTIAQIIADNYDLSEAEKDLLKSGYLVSDTYTYGLVYDGEMISVDTENNKITARSDYGWAPVKVVIVYGDNELEVTPDENGVAIYDPAVVGNAFSVKAVYELTDKFAVSTQEALLGAAALLKQGVQNLKDVAAQSGNLYVLETAMPELVDLANNGYVVNGTTTYMPQAFIDAVNNLNGQMTANEGILNLTKLINAYDASAAKTGYLMTEGTNMEAEVIATAAEVAVIAEEIATLAKNLETLLSFGFVSTELAQKIKNLSTSINALNDELISLKEASWAVDAIAAVLAENVDYIGLDAKVAALGEITAVTVKETLKVAETNLQVNMAMFNVTYEVYIEHIVDNAQVTDLLKEQTVTLAEGATKAALEAELNALLDEVVFPEFYNIGAFTATTPNIPDSLTEDVTIKVTYFANYYTVTIAGEAQTLQYGTVVTLPVHADPAKSYDYLDADGNYYAQGTQVTVTGNMTFTRTEGKAYTTIDLYTIIADNFAGESQKAIAILTSGAVKGNESISYREPSKGELEELVKLDGNTLTVQTYASSYAGLSWAPYSYIVDGNENLFSGASVVTLPADFTNVSVYYRLTMTNHTAAEVQSIMEMVAVLAAEAEGQKSVMDRLAGFESQISQLNKNMLNGLVGMIGGYSVSNGGSFSDALVEQMKATINDIVANCCTGNDLNLVGIINSYNDPNNGGLTYYYQNAEYVKVQIAYLSEKLEALLGDPQGKELIATLLKDMSYSDYVEKLDDLNAKMAQINADLKSVNVSIDTTDAAKLSALAKALSDEGEITFAESASPYVEMGPVNRVADKYVTAEVKVTVNGKTGTFTTEAIGKGTALTQAQVNSLKAEIAAFVGQVDTRFFNNDYSNGSELDALVGKALDKSVAYEYTWTAKEYTVKIDGEADQTVSINNLTITLPEHPDAAYGLSYEYTIGSVTANAGIYTFAAEDLLNLFRNGELTITRIEKNANVEALEKMVANINIEMGFKALTLVAEDGKYTGIEANVSANDLMSLMMGLVMKSGYGYIGLNGEGFIYSTADGLELSLQTLINALFNDESFSEQTFVALAKNGKGKLMSATMQLGEDAANIDYSNLTFTLNLSSVPEMVTEKADLIAKACNYITFHSDNGVMAFELNLPDQAYAAYAAVLVAVGHVDKNDVNGLTNKVPVQFVYDYLTAITGSEMDLITYTNTLEMLGFNQDLTDYVSNNTYTQILSAYNERVSVEIDDDKTSVGITAPGQMSINALLKLAGIDTSSISQFLPMLKEYKAGNDIVINATGRLSNPDKTYYALVLDAQADGVTNKMEAPSSYASLAKETAELAGYSYIILTADVPGDLTIAGTTLLDLNGFNVEGTINATGKLFIIDTSLSTYDAGTVNNVTGNAVIIAGNYLSDISSKLKDGYYMEGTTVRHTLYTMKDVDGVMTFTLNGDFYEDENCSGYIPDVKALAVDIAADLLMNYYNTAMIGVDEYELVHMNFDDLVGLYADDDRVTELAKKLLSAFTVGEAGYENNAGFEGVVNLILADLLNFEQITEGLKNNSALATHTLVTAPWTIKIDHNTEGNYATLDVCANMDLKKECKFAIAIESKFNDNVAAMTEILAEIVVKDETYAMVDIPTPTYSDKTLTISGAGKTSMVMDMSADNKYAVAIAVVLAYGNPSKAEAVAAAVNANDMEALKVVVDNTSVKEIFTALKKMSRNVSFADMAAQVGVTVDTAAAADLEGRFHLVFCAAGKALEELDITGMDSKLGALYNEETGYYELTKGNIFRDKEFEVRGYSALIELEATELTLKVKLFDDGCLWGDANHDGIVDTFDATLVEMYAVGTAPEMFCTIRTDVNGDGSIDSMDATLIRMYTVGSITVFPAENK